MSEDISENTSGNTKIPAEEIMNALCTEKYKSSCEDAKINWNGVTIMVHPHLSLMSAAAFTYNVVKSVFDSETGEYMPEYTPIATARAILLFYTNVGEPKSLEDLYELTMFSSLIDEVMDVIDHQQYNDIKEATKRKIDLMAQANISAITKQINEIASDLNDIVSSIQGVFSGIDAETIESINDAITSGALDTDKLVASVIEHNTAKE